MTDASAGRKESERHSSSNFIGVVIVVALGLALVSAPLYALLRSRTAEPAMTGMGNVGGTSVRLTSLEPQLAGLYRSARSHGPHFEQIPCFCGCQEGRLEHRHLLDCFVLRDGGGWESHATGCGVCQGEARMALRLLNDGVAVQEVRTRVIDAYGMPVEMQDA